MPNQTLQRALEARVEAQERLEHEIRVAALKDRTETLARCQAAGVTQSELARILGVTRQRIGQLLKAD